jgi:hypothetical protein
MGLELGTAGITSPGDFVDTGWDDETAERLDRLFERELAEVEWTDNLHQGYVRVVLGRDEATADFVAVDNLRTPSYRAAPIKRTRIVRAKGTLDFA